MGHFAKVCNGVVVRVEIGEPEKFANYVDTSPGDWIQTSYNTRGGVHYEPNSDTPSEDQSKALRKNFAGVGFTYDAQRDAFIPPKPYTNWILDENSCQWKPPIEIPDNENLYNWNQEENRWELVDWQT